MISLYCLYYVIVIIYALCLSAFVFFSLSGMQFQHGSPSSTGSAHTDSSSCSSVKTAPTHSSSHKAIQVADLSDFFGLSEKWLVSQTESVLEKVSS